jgi:multisubunit Na+/H+ antiporter MnhF subunit
MNDLLFEASVYVLVVAMLLGFWRLAKGPSVIDRIIAFDAMVMCALGQVVLLSRLWFTALYLDLVLIVMSLGFVSALALVFYLQKTLPDRAKGGGEREGGEA